MGGQAGGGGRGRVGGGVWGGLSAPLALGEAGPVGLAEVRAGRRRERARRWEQKTCAGMVGSERPCSESSEVRRAAAASVRSLKRAPVR